MQDCGNKNPAAGNDLAAKEVKAMNKTIFLIGFMGAGKSTVAQELKNRLGFPVVEMDARIAEQEGMSIPDIFEKKGEPYFRKLETELLESFTADAPAIVSCGGGAAMREENVAAMHRGGVTVLLKASPETILERVKDNDDRPLLRGKKNTSDIQKLMDQRYPKYEAAADIAVDTSGLTVPEVCDAILSELDKM